MITYLNMLDHVVRHGEERTDRTGTGTISIFGYHAAFDLQQGFPLLTTKKLHWKSIKYELIWMLSGNTNINYLKENNVTIWDEWADANGELGPVYGHQWRSFGKGYDQIKNVIKNIIKDPYSRRHVVSAWNPDEVDEMRLPPCHVLFQFYVRNNGLLDCHLYQRSADVFLGVPFNIASYALLTHIIARCTNYNPGKLFVSYGDLHLYKNHLEQASEQLTRVPKPLPGLTILQDKLTLGTLNPEDFIITNYDCHPSIKAEVSK